MNRPGKGDAAGLAGARLRAIDLTDHAQRLRQQFDNLRKPIHSAFALIAGTPLFPGASGKI
jgi:hypothetical protein